MCRTQKIISRHEGYFLAFLVFLPPERLHKFPAVESSSEEPTEENVNATIHQFVNLWDVIRHKHEVGGEVADGVVLETRAKCLQSQVGPKEALPKDFVMHKEFSFARSQGGGSLRREHGIFCCLGEVRGGAGGGVRGRVRGGQGAAGANPLCQKFVQMMHGLGLTFSGTMF